MWTLDKADEPLFKEDGMKGNLAKQQINYGRNVSANQSFWKSDSFFESLEYG